MDQPASEQRKDLQSLIAAARNGCDRSADELLEACRGYMLSIANNDLDSILTRKLGASDIVQESLIEAQRDIGRFGGNSEAELLSWLRQIVKNNLHDVRRRYLATEKRNVSREESLEGSGSFSERHVSVGKTPSQVLHNKDESQQLLNAMNNLTKDHRQVIELRNWELLPFAEIAKRTNRSEDAARKLWARAITSLKHEMAKSNVRNESQ